MPITVVLLVVLLCALFSNLAWLLIPFVVFCGFAVVVGLIKRRCA
jgi:hypothetical protein